MRVVSKDSQDKGRLSLTLKLELARDGGRAKLSFLGLTYEVIRIGNTLYVKGNPALYKRLFRRSGLHVPQGTWLKTSADSGKLAQLATFTHASSELARLLASTGPLTKGATRTIDGQRSSN